MYQFQEGQCRPRVVCLPPCLLWVARAGFLKIIVGGALLFPVMDVLAARISNIENTKHNLSSSGVGTVKSGGATTTTEVCVFCHTPHAATQRDQGGNSLPMLPLWNRKLPDAVSYAGSGYSSNSLDERYVSGSFDGLPGGSSKLCLSCHDGTVAVGNVNVFQGGYYGGVPLDSPVVTMEGTSSDKMPSGDYGSDTGFTRNLGVDLSNDHPISVSFNTGLSDADGELRGRAGSPEYSEFNANQRYVGTNLPAGASYNYAVGVRDSQTGTRPMLPLKKPVGGGDGQVQCASCHDPHMRESSPSALDYGNDKFLRANRFQVAPPAGDAFDYKNDLICLACHDKGRQSWSGSAHANSVVAASEYKTSSSALRDFPTSIALPVWKAACVNCHDTHTVPGARRLLREGVGEGGASPKSAGASAIEETCYQCHRPFNDPAQVLSLASQTVPDIRTDFLSLRRMPIITGAQGGGAAVNELHDIGPFQPGTSGRYSIGGVDCTTPTNKCGADFVEFDNNLGKTDLGKRHAECTDCHNPHRVVKFQSGIRSSLLGLPDKAGTHRHEDDVGYEHTNVISGVLRGMWGVEPTYLSESFQNLPSGYLVKRGDPGAATDTGVSSSYVTREYQICLKCHSDFAYPDDNSYPSSLNRPQLGGPGLTPVNTNLLVSYTNQAKEFQAPFGHMGQPGDFGFEAGASASNDTKNHRSWHPVMGPTGRSGTLRGGGGGNDISGNWNKPFSNAVGTQTMYCSDCHGSSTGTTSAMPVGNTNANENGKPWGPHGSDNDFILKGTWSSSSGTGGENSDICFKCHRYALYATRGGGRSGFGGSRSSNLHDYHADKVGKMRCTWCHIAVPHGWKNKALLVNLNDIGPEAGMAVGTQVRNRTTALYNRAPYYLGAINKIKTFANSSSWSDTDCGSKGFPGNGITGRSWMRDSNENCASPP